MSCAVSRLYAGNGSIKARPHPYPRLRTPLCTLTKLSIRLGYKLKFSLSL